MRRVLFALLLWGCGQAAPVKRDAGVDAASPLDFAVADLTAPSAGTKVASGAQALLLVTGDDWVIVSAADGVSAIKLADGTKVAITADPKAQPFPRGNVVFVWHNVDAKGNGPLAVWSAAGGV